MSASRRGAIRWWWWVGLAWVFGYALLVLILYRQPAFRRWIITARIITLAPLLAGVAWLVVIAPLLESSVRGFTDRRTPRRRGRICLVFAWIPTVLFTLLLVQYAAIKTLGIRDFGWFGRGYLWWVIGAVVISLIYGRLMTRRFDERVRAAAAREDVCYACNYRLTGIASDRCPECGEPVRPPRAGRR